MAFITIESFVKLVTSNVTNALAQQAMITSTVPLVFPFSSTLFV